MDQRTKKNKVSKGEPELHPIGLLQNAKKTTGIFIDSEDSDSLFTLSKTERAGFLKKRTPITFKNKLLKRPLHPSEIEGISSARIGKKDIITFVYGKGNHKKAFWASQKTKHEWRVEGTLPSTHNPVALVSGYTYEKKYVAYYGETAIHLALSSDLKKWKKIKEPVIRPRPGFFDHGPLKLIAVHHSSRGLLVFYDASEQKGSDMLLQIGVGLFSLTNPEKIIWRADIPVFQEKVIYGKDMECKGTIFLNGIVSFYWYGKNKGVMSASIPEPFGKRGRGEVPKLEKSLDNPIVVPEKSWWRSEATLNPAAINIDGTVHLLFRAMGYDGISRIGYARSDDGLRIDEISPEPVFSLHQPYIGKRTLKKRYDPVLYPSGGSWGGCEDPRIVEIDGRIYMTFNSFDGWDNMRVGLTSIEVADFLHKQWNWEKPQLISPGRAKNWLLFPEKVHGKFALLHSIHADEPDRIRIEYFNSLDDIDTNKMHFESPDPQRVAFKRISWHVHMRSATTPPIKTANGWLVFYHAHHADELHRYKLGAMLLDLDDPTKVIARSSTPILVPDMWYENEGKPGVVYANGAIIKDDTLFIYYGGGDKHICVATVPFHAFMEALQSTANQTPILMKVAVA